MAGNMSRFLMSMLSFVSITEITAYVINNYQKVDGSSFISTQGLHIKVDLVTSTSLRPQLPSETIKDNIDLRRQSGITLTQVSEPPVIINITTEQRDTAVRMQPSNEPKITLMAIDKLFEQSPVSMTTVSNDDDDDEVDSILSLPNNTEQTKNVKSPYTQTQPTQSTVVVTKVIEQTNKDNSPYMRLLSSLPSRMYYSKVLEQRDNSGSAIKQSQDPLSFVIISKELDTVEPVQVRKLTATVPALPATVEIKKLLLDQDYREHAITARNTFGTSMKETSLSPVTQPEITTMQPLSILKYKATNLEEVKPLVPTPKKLDLKRALLGIVQEGTNFLHKLLDLVQDLNAVSEQLSNTKDNRPNCDVLTEYIRV